MNTSTQRPIKRPTSGKGSGLRRRYRGRMVKPDGDPRSQHIDRLTSPTTYTCGDTALPKALPTKSKGLGRFRVTAPTKRAHRRGHYESVEV